VVHDRTVALELPAESAKYGTLNRRLRGVSDGPLELPAESAKYGTLNRRFADAGDPSVGRFSWR
jgi:hypothetical protein